MLIMQNCRGKKIRSFIVFFTFSKNKIVFHFTINQNIFEVEKTEEHYIIYWCLEVELNKLWK